MKVSYIHPCTLYSVHCTHTIEGQKEVQVKGLDDVDILSHCAVQV